MFGFLNTPTGCRVIDIVCLFALCAILLLAFSDKPFVRRVLTPITIFFFFLAVGITVYLENPEKVVTLSSLPTGGRYSHRPMITIPTECPINPCSIVFDPVPAEGREQQVFRVRTQKGEVVPSGYFEMQDGHAVPIEYLGAPARRL